MYQLDVLIRSIEELPCPLGPARYLRELTSGRADDPDDPDDADAVDGQVERLIGCEPALAAGLFRLAGQADRATGQVPATIRAALEAVDRSSVGGMAVLAELQAVLPGGTGSGYPPQLDGLRDHCLAVAEAARLLVERGRLGIDPQEAFAA
ncbi:MAG: hypothetical protein J7M21_04115, partial [Planctomycetes bacterium]|nr:hypothetical protein [Planctomycetota bacterium]